MYVRLLDPCFKTGQMEPCSHQDAHTQATPSSSSTQGWSTRSLLLTSCSILKLIVVARCTAYVLLMTCHHACAQSSRQAHWHTEILPHYTFIPHFKFSKFKHIYLSFQSPVSPFPQGTCLLLVSNTYSALDEHYHRFMHQCQGTQLVKCTPCAGMLQLTHRVFTLIDALFQEPVAASPLVMHPKTTNWGHMPRFPL